MTMDTGAYNPLPELRRQMEDVRNKNTQLEVDLREARHAVKHWQDKFNDIIEGIDWSKNAHTKTVNEDDFVSTATLTKVAEQRDIANERAERAERELERLSIEHRTALQHAQALLGAAEMRYDEMLAKYERAQELVKQYDEGHAALRKEIKELGAKLVGSTPQGNIFNMLKYNVVNVTFRQTEEDGTRQMRFIPALVFYGNGQFTISGTNELSGSAMRFSEDAIVTWHPCDNGIDSL